jgi:hypothetical protein
MVSIQASTTLRSDHFQNAKRFRDEAKRIEATYSSVNPDDSSSIPNEDKKKHRAYCLNSIISTACFLEATINHLYWEIWDDLNRINNGDDPIHYPDVQDYRQNIIRAERAPPRSRKRLSNRREDAGIIGNYNIFLDVNGFDEFDKDTVPAEPVDRVLDIRNELVHFSPRWIQGGGKEYTENEYGFEGSLKDQFELNPLMPSGNAFFPDQCLSYGCAEWSARVSKGFVSQFSKRIDLEIHPDITLPW